MNRNWCQRIIISAHKTQYEQDKDFQSIAHFVEPTVWGEDMATYEFVIHFYPTYSLLDNNFSFKQNIADEGECKLPYQRYLYPWHIWSLSYFDYSGEKIYRLAIQDQSKRTDWDEIEAKNLVLLTGRLLKYLRKHPLTEYQAETLEELQKLNLVAKFCKKRKYKVIAWGADD